MLIKFAAEVQYLKPLVTTQKILYYQRDHPIHALVGVFGTSYHVSVS